MNEGNLVLGNKKKVYEKREGGTERAPPSSSRGVLFLPSPRRRPGFRDACIVWIPVATGMTTGRATQQPIKARCSALGMSGAARQVFDIDLLKFADLYLEQ